MAKLSGFVLSAGYVGVVFLLFLFYYSSLNDGERGTRCARGALAVAHHLPFSIIRWSASHERAHVLSREHATHLAVDFTQPFRAILTT